VALAAGLSGCPRNILGEGSEGAVRVEGVRAQFTAGDRGEFEIDFALENPTGIAATVSGIEWEVWLGGRWFAAGTLALSEALPAQGSHSFKVMLPVVFRRSGAASAEPTSIEIGVRGRLTLAAGGHVHPLAFQDRRRIVAANVPSIRGGIDER
jgi:hypothetical protein